MIILLILITSSHDNVWISLGENCCWSLLGLKRVKGVTYVPSLNFKTCRFTYKRGSYECISLLLSQFEPIFVSFVTIAAVLHHCFKAMSLVRIFTPTGPHNKIAVKCPSFLCNYLLYPGCHHFCNFF